MEGIDSLENEFYQTSTYYDIKQKPNVILKDGFETNELEAGVDFEIKEKYKEEDEDNEPEPFFDTEELFQQLNYECIDGATDADADEDKSPFELIKEKMTAITEDNGVLKMIVKKGTGEIASYGAICRVHYNGYLEYRDEPFDSTRLRNRQEQVRLGDSFIHGFDVALATMRKGEISKFIFSHEYAYREMGCPPRIPPNASGKF